jgi:tetratricopeptide (TPR) repeat protein
MGDRTESAPADAADLASGLFFGAGLLVAAMLVLRTMLTGFSEPSVANFMLIALCALLSVVVATWAALKKSLVLPQVWVVVPLGALLVFGAISAAGAHHQRPAELQLMNWVTNALFFLMVFSLCAAPGERGRAARRVIVAAVVASAVVMALYGIYQRFQVMPTLLEKMKQDPEGRELLKIPGAVGRVQSAEVFATFVTPNAYAGYLALLLPAALGAAAWGLRSKQKQMIGAAGAAAAVVCVALLFTGSPGGWVSAAAGVTVLALILRGRPAFGAIERKLGSRRAAVIAISSTAAVAVLVSAAVFLSTDSMRVRLQYWIAALRMFVDNPLGVGLGNFGDYVPQYRTPAGWETREVHNVYLGLLVEAGPMAAAAFAVLVYGAIRALKRTPLPLASDADLRGEEPDGVVTGHTGLLALSGGLSAMFAAYAVGAVTPDGMHSERIVELFAGALRPGTVAGALTHMAFLPIWGGIFVLLYKKGVDSAEVRSGLIAGLAALLVHGLVEFDFQIKTTMLTACALGAVVLSSAPWRIPLHGVKRPLPALLLAVILVPLVARGSLRGWRLWELSEFAESELQRAELLETAAADLSAQTVSGNYDAIEPILMAVDEVELRVAIADIRDSISMGQYGRLKRDASAFGVAARREARTGLRRAWERLSEYLEIEPGDDSKVMLLVRVAKMLEIRAIDVKTRDTVERAIRLLTVRAPDAFTSWMALGHFHAQQGHLTQAAASFRKAADRYPLNSRIWLRLGDTAVFFDDAKALEAYGKALETNRTNEDENTSLFAWLWEAAPVRPTSADLMAKLDAQAESVPTLFRRGLLYWQIGGFQEAAAQFAKALAIQPGDPQLSAFSALFLDMNSTVKRTQEAADASAEAWRVFETAQQTASPDRRLPMRMVALFAARRPALRAVVGGKPPQQ